MQQEANKLS